MVHSYYFWVKHTEDEDAAGIAAIARGWARSTIFRHGHRCSVKHWLTEWSVLVESRTG